MKKYTNATAIIREQAEAKKLDLREQRQKGNEVLTNLKNSFDEKRDRNNNNRGFGLAVSLGICIATYIANASCQQKEIKLVEALRRLNELENGKILPEDVPTFKELYDSVKADFKLDNTFNKTAESGPNHQILRVVTAGFFVASAFLGYKTYEADILKYLETRQQDLTSPPEDSMEPTSLESQKKRHHPEFGQ